MNKEPRGDILLGSCYRSSIVVIGGRLHGVRDDGSKTAEE